MSLLPAATEGCFLLGAGEKVVGVSHECDFPPAARDRPALTRSRVDAQLPSAELDRAIQALGKKGEGLFDVDERLLAELAPDLIVTQQQCAVCAVAPKDLEAALARIRPAPAVFAWDATTYEGVLADLRRLGRAVGRAREAKQLLVRNWALAKEVRSRVHGLDRPRVAVIDWIEPLMFAGNWVPELVDMAGGEYGLVPSGKPSRWGSWEELEEFEPDVIVAAPCGRSLERATDELRTALHAHDQEDLAPVLNGRVFLADGNAYFNRPGPRLVYAGALLARALHWDRVPALPPAIEAGLRPLPTLRA